jgi:hypothetical protein
VRDQVFVAGGLAREIENAFEVLTRASSSNNQRLV